MYKKTRVRSWARSDGCSNCEQMSMHPRSRPPPSPKRKRAMRTRPGTSSPISSDCGSAETHPEHVRAMLLRGVLLLRPEELDWFYRDGASRFQPEAWARFAIVGTDDLIAAYYALLASPDAAEAARAWSRWEATASSFLPSAAVTDYLTEPQRSFALARLETHYFDHGGWLAGRALLANIDRIRHIPTIVVQGRYDLVCPPRSPWDLQRVWPEVDLRIVDGAGHISQDPANALARRASSSRHARRRERARKASSATPRRLRLRDPASRTEGPRRRDEAARLEVRNELRASPLAGHLELAEDRHFEGQRRGSGERVPLLE